MAVYFWGRRFVCWKTKLEKHVSNFHEIHGDYNDSMHFFTIPPTNNKEKHRKAWSPGVTKNNNRGAFFFKTAHPTPQNWVVETVVRKTPGTLSVWRKSMMIKTVDFHTCCNWPRLAVGPLQGRNLLKGSFSATMVHPFFSYYSCFWQIETVNTYIKQIFKIKYIHTSKKTYTTYLQYLYANMCHILTVIQIKYIYQQKRIRPSSDWIDGGTRSAFPLRRSEIRILIKGKSGFKMSKWKNNQPIAHTIHVWYIYLHLVNFCGKCR